MIKLFQYSICLCLVLAANLAIGQRAISGTIMDENDSPMPGVAITIEGTTIGTLTNADGHYRIIVPGGAIAINVSFAGYREESMNIKGVTRMDFKISSDGIQMMNVEYDDPPPPPPPPVGWTKSRASFVTREARSLASRGNLDKALSYLDDQINDVSGSEHLASYRAYFLFTKGYLLQHNQNGQTDEHLESAQSAYREALRYQPGDEKILNNLIQVSQEMGDYQTANRYVQTAMDADEEHKSEWKAVSGDLYRKTDQIEDAWAAYASALNADPGNRDAARKLISMYPSLENWDETRLINKCRELDETGMTELAVDGLESIIKMNCTGENELNEDLLLTWAGMLAGNDWVRPRIAKRLEALGCKFRPIMRIMKNIREGWPERLDQQSWWSQEENRQFYYYAMQKSWADYQLSIGKKKKAMDLYFGCKEALEGVSDYSAQVYGREGVLEMEVLIQLARLFGDGELDPTGDNFYRLEESLFGLKGEAYRSNDLESIQKFHTILGLIYVHRKEWQGGGAQNARFQLNRAIRTASQRAKNDPSTYTPMPHLYKNLGDTYHAINNQERAGAAYLDATVHYLESDNLTNSKAMLEKAKDQKVDKDDSSQKEKFLQVQNLFEARISIIQLEKRQYDPNSQDYYRTKKSFQWLDQASEMDKIDASILERQKFKVVADLSNQAKKVGANDQSALLQDEAKTKLNEMKILSSQQDVLRVKQIESKNQLLQYQRLQPKAKEPATDLKKKNEVILPNKTSQKTRVIKSKNN